MAQWYKGIVCILVVVVVDRNENPICLLAGVNAPWYGIIMIGQVCQGSSKNSTRYKYLGRWRLRKLAVKNTLVEIVGIPRGFFQTQSHLSP
jgi:hypothetical protein